MRLLDPVLRARIKTGSLSVIDWTGSRTTYGSGLPHVTVRLHDRATALRILLDPELAAGEAYMDGTLTIEEGGSIYDLLDLVLMNSGWAYPDLPSKVGNMVRVMGRRLAQFNPAERARRNVAAHYDLPDELYDLFLDPDRQYSCAYFLSPDDTIERAQAQKKRHIAAKLLLQPGQRVLDIGSGWGGLALTLNELSGADVTGLTLSRHQHEVSQDRARAAGRGDSVRFLLQDYREVQGPFDRIVSVGMFEHVGVNHYTEYFRRIHDLLTPDGVALVHAIGRADGPGATNPWIQRYIFPGGYCPALSEVFPAVERARLHVTDVEILRLHYAETLKRWRERFMANRAKIAERQGEAFCRMWEFYLAGSEATFRHAGHMVWQIQLAKRVDAVPLTRDYIGAFEAANDLAAPLAPVQRHAAE